MKLSADTDQEEICLTTFNADMLQPTTSVSKISYLVGMIICMESSTQYHMHMEEPKNK
jgi:predicted membrane channel-forming protein YqfA (hemolysin III family)